MHVRLIKSFGFEAAHWLPTFPRGHKCRRMHGHSFRVDVVIEGEVEPEQGYLIDRFDPGPPTEQQHQHYHCRRRVLTDHRKRDDRVGVPHVFANRQGI